MASTPAQLAHYQRHKDLYKVRGAESRKKIKRRNRDYINAAKQSPCLDCGGSFPPCVMDFHHRGEDKEMNVSRMLNRPLAAVQAEIDKCDLICANCHRMRHYGE